MKIVIFGIEIYNYLSEKNIDKIRNPVDDFFE